MTRIRIKAPLHMTLNITGFCSLDCLYCYAQPFTGQYITFDKIIDILEEVRRLCVFQIKIGGGEPLLHPNIIDLIRYAVDNKLSLAILTSLAINQTDFIRRFSEIVAPHRFINVQVSLDSLDPNINDKVRGKACLVKENIELMLKYGIDLQLASVVTKYNLDSVLRIIDFYYPRIKRFHFMNLMPTLKLTQSKGFWDLVPSKDELSTFWEAASNKGAILPKDVKITKNELASDSECEQIFKYNGCSAGITSCEVDSNLDVLACNIARRFVIGNLSSQSLEEVWYSQSAEKVREIPVPLCLANLCNGGACLPPV